MDVELLYSCICSFSLHSEILFNSIPIIHIIIIYLFIKFYLIKTL